MSEYEPQHAAEPADPVVGGAPPRANILLSNRVYNTLKPVAQIWLPALAVLYLAVAPLWGLPKQEEVAGTIMAIDLFLGAVLGISNQQYRNSDARFDGNIVIEPGESDDVEGEALTSKLNVSLDPMALATKKEIVVKVDKA